MEAMEAQERISQVWTEFHASLERFVSKRVDDPADGQLHG